MKKSVNIIININTAIATKASTYCPEATDSLSRLPKPGRVNVFEPTDMISAAVRKYHPAAQDRMLL
jgi:hypothetical protein